MQIVMYSIILSEALILIFEIPILPYIEKFNSKEQRLFKKEVGENLFVFACFE